MDIKLIHVRFSPDSTVIEISEKPAHMSPQGWFDHLCMNAGTCYQTLSGGRGLFRVPAADWDTLAGALSK